MSKIKIEYYSGDGFRSTANEKIEIFLMQSEAKLLALFVLFLFESITIYGYVSGGIKPEFAAIFTILILLFASIVYCLATFVLAIDDNHTGKANKFMALIIMDFLLKKDLIEGKRVC